MTSFEARHARFRPAFVSQTGKTEASSSLSDRLLALLLFVMSHSLAQWDSMAIKASFGPLMAEVRGRTGSPPVWCGTGQG